MALWAILLDLVGVGSYFLQVKVGKGWIYGIGLIIQIALVIGLIAIAITYNGKRHSRWNFEGYRYLTIGYGIVIVSAVIMAIVLFLYVLNILGINDIIFSMF